jgi:tetratricopeptide (TPR) repeat protein
MPKKLTLSLFVLLLSTGLRAQSPGLSLFVLIMDLANNKSVPIEVVTPPALPKEEARLERQRIFAEIKQLNKAIIQYPDSMPLRYARGLLRTEIGVVEDAREDFRKCQEKNYLADSCRFKLALFHLYTSPRVAQEIFDDLLRKNTSYPQLYYYRGLNHLYWGTRNGRNMKNESELAIPEFDNALRLNNQYWEALFMRGFAKQKAGDYAGAALDYSKVMELKPALDYLLLFRGAAHQDSGNTKQACRDFQAAAGKGIEGADKFLKKYCGR